MAGGSLPALMFVALLVSGSPSAVAAPVHRRREAPIPRDPSADKMRLDKEASRLFAQIIKDEPEPLKPCELKARWESVRIDEDVARKALDLQVHADLLPPETVADPATVIGPLAKEAFCEDKAYDQREKTLVEAWQSDHKALPAAARKPSGFMIGRVAYGFPIFDRAFNRAVVVRKNDGRGFSFASDGTRLRGSIEGGGQVLVYRRKAGLWRKIDEIETYNYD